MSKKRKAQSRASSVEVITEDAFLLRKQFEDFCSTAAANRRNIQNSAVMPAYLAVEKIILSRWETRGLSRFDDRAGWAVISWVCANWPRESISNA